MYGRVHIERSVSTSEQADRPYSRHLAPLTDPQAVWPVSTGSLRPQAAPAECTRYIGRSICLIDVVGAEA